VRDSRKSPVLWLDRILADSPPVGGRLRYGGGGERSELLGGGFAIDQLTARPLLEALPAVVHLRGHDGRAPEWLSGLIRMIAVEMASTRPVPRPWSAGSAMRCWPRRCAGASSMRTGRRAGPARSATRRSRAPSG
jgi:cupin